ncbi:BTB/POZ domain-containing protein KCTD16 [Labeo rohita]|uniref:BTB/POZ domain-containing protein KCTD16 n=1 Tax=Labeo rohita TaxID=84645 RepID=A0ABQ8M1E2_LABRO|nr:BTB/POZ domain-containing protein KCTD16 [Labeo rohita]
MGLEYDPCSRMRGSVVARRSEDRRWAGYSEMQSISCLIETAAISSASINGDTWAGGPLIHGAGTGLPGNRIARGGPSGWSSSHCDCCCKSHKSEREGESGTSFNELSTSCSESQSDASSPQETVIVRPVTRQPNIQTLDRPVKKGPTPIPRRTDLLRVRNAGQRDVMAGKRKPTKEKMTPAQELEKCIQDFRRIKIPERFPERKYMWQSELLKKYKL